MAGLAKLEELSVDVGAEVDCFEALLAMAEARGLARVEMCRDVSIGFAFTEREVEVAFDTLRAGLAEEAGRVISRLEGLRPTRVRVRLPLRAKLESGEAGGALVARRTGESLDLAPVVAAAEKVGAAFEVDAAPAVDEKASPAKARRRR